MWITKEWSGLPNSKICKIVKNKFVKKMILIDLIREDYD